MNRTKTTLRKILAMALSVCMMLTMTPISVAAEGTGCTHEHDEGCGYTEGADCTFTHEHSEECGYTEGAPCGYVHEHDGDCGYESDSGCTDVHEHDSDCGYESESDSGCTDAHQHDDSCGYAEAVACGHAHDEDCVGGSPLGNSGITVPQTGEITAFAELDAGIASQNVPLGTEVAALTLPGTLLATFAVDGEEMTIPIPVTWQSVPDYDGDTASTYVFAAIVDGFTVSAELPSITVTVSEAALTGGVITAFDELPEDIRFQRDYSPNLPETVRGTVNGEAADIPVTWQAEHYEGPGALSGLFAFIAEVGEGYALEYGISAPTIAFYQVPIINPMMAGQGTSGAPLEITNAAQLFEIAALVNAGKLETTILGSATATVYLKLMNGIDLSAYSSGAGWTPIGSTTSPFKGSFDGNSNTITGLIINSTADYTGLFGVVGVGGIVKNLGLENVNISGGSNVGGVAGTVSGTVTKCYVTGTVSGGSNVGGVAGSVSGTVTYCAALNASVSGTPNVGRVVGSGTGLTYNVAFGGMKITGDSVTSDATLKDGASRDATELGGLSGTYLLPIPLPAYITDAPGTDQYFFGGGVDGNPFLINTAADLKKLADLVNTLGAEGNEKYGATGVYYKLTADIDLSAYNTGAGWVPIGDAGPKPFKGNFDGVNHVITGLFINREAPCTGLFGEVNGGTIQNLGLVGVNITSTDQHVGGVVGRIDSGKLINCYVTGAVTKTGTGTNTGGLAGVVSGTASLIENCYTTCKVSGGENTGGVAGSVSNGPTVQNCYATGAVIGTEKVGGVAGLVISVITAKVENCAALNPSVTGSSNVGRVAGYLDEGPTITNNVAFDGMTGGTWTDINANGLDGADITASAITGDIGNRFVTGGGWEVPTPSDTLHLPGLGERLVEKPAHLLDSTAPFPGTGADAANAYEISTAAQLAKLAELVNGDTAGTVWANKFYKLTADIDLSAYGTGAGWTPIGTVSNPFKGNFDGNGKVITGLYINRSTENYIGLFGNVDGGTVKNLGLVGVDITGGSYTGGVAGQVNGTVENCYVTGAVKGGSNDYIGGVAGTVGSGGIVKNCYATATVNGTTNVGGVAGNVSGGTVQNCAALNPSVSGTSNVGRVMGSGSGTGNRAFSGMTVTGGSVAGNGNTVTGIDGEDMSAGDALTATFWTSTMGWSGSGSPWTIDDDYLPYFGTAKVDFGLYLTPKTLAHAAVTLSQTSFTYNGAEQKPTVEVKFDGETLTVGTDYTVSYSPDNINAGTVTITVTGMGNYQGTATATFTIGKASPTALTLPTASSITYGTALLTSTLTGGSMTGTWAWTNGTTFPTVSNSGYEVTFTPSDTNNYDWTGVSGWDVGTSTVKRNISVTVNKADPTVTFPTSATLTYGQTLALATLSGQSNTTPGTFAFNAPNMQPTVAQSGNFPMTFTPSDTANYNTKTQNVNVTVGKKTVAGVNQTYEVVKNNAQTYSFDLTTLLPNVSPLTLGTVDYSFVSATNSGAFQTVPTVTSISGTTLTLDVASAATGSIGTVVIGFTNANFDISNATITVEVIDKTPVTITATMNGGTYNGNPFAYTGAVVRKNSDNTNVTAAVGSLNALYESTDSGGHNSATPPTKAGAYKLTLSVPAGHTTYSGSAEFDFTISKATIIITADNKTAYVGSPAPAYTYTVTGLASVESLATPPTLTCTPDMNAVGTYTITPSGAVVPNVDNYNAIVYVDGTLTVTAIQQRTISYNANGGSGTMSSDTVNNGSPYTIKANAFTRSGYTFSGWRTASSGGTSYAAGTTIPSVTANITLYAQWTSNNTGNDSGSSSSGGVSGGLGGWISSLLTPPEQWLEQNPAGTLASGANSKSQDYARTKHNGVYGVRAASWAKLTGLRYEHDTMDGNSVQVRVYIIEPAKLTKDMKVSGWIKGSEVDKIKAHFEKWFKNKLRVIHLDQQGDWGQNVNIAAKVDLTGMDTENLYFYSYDKATNSYRHIEKPAYWIDTNGYLRFTTPYAGDIIISEGPLEKK